MDAESEPCVLVVDDEQAVADAYALRLGTWYATRVAYEGEAALEAVDDDVDVMLLDRRMPGLSGDDVLAQLHESGARTRVIMVTAVDPHVDVLDLGFDDYLCKPVDRETLRDAIEFQLSVGDEDEQVREYLSLVATLSVLAAKKSSIELEREERYLDACERRDHLHETLAASVSGLDDMVTQFETIGHTC
ncbi:response regulator [Haloarchaeobius sp. DFWS5]|uniref:response regulator n=1 Tax=Haloarchaeobius sp. DFWS5 TaxID=3446114 RepID=UPI003EBFF860